MKEFPDCFPENFETEILPEDAREDNKDVYRVIKNGILDRESFISTYEEIQRGLIPPKKRLNLKAPGTYSTSCNMQYSEAQYALNVFMRHHPRAFIAKGVTEGSCGPSQLTSEREERDNTHVDWWVYKGGAPQFYFNVIYSKNSPSSTGGR